MKNIPSHIKKYGLYVLAVIGALALILILWKLFFGRGPITPYRYDKAVSIGLAPGGFAPEFAADTATFAVSQGLREAPSVLDSPEGDLTARKIIKNGSLDVLVDKAEDTAEKIKEIAKRFEGFVENVNIYEVSKDIKEGVVVIRVPADSFTEVMNEIKELVIKVEREQVDARDVTEQFIDLEARLKNLQAEEEQYLKILKQADTVEDLLNVSRELSRVRGQIERLEGQLKYLSRQIDMSSITVHLTAIAEVEIFGVHWRPLVVIKQSLKGLFEGLTKFVDVIIIFLIKLPVIIIWIASIAFLLFIIWRIGKWIWRKLA